MVAFILFKAICCTLNMLLNILCCLLREVTVCILVIAIKALKLPGAALQSALEQIGGLIRCCVERLLVSILKNALNAIQKVADLFFNLAVDVVSRLVAGAMERVGQESAKKMKSALMELMLGVLKIAMKTSSTSVRLLYNLVVDVISSSTGKMGGETLSILLELMKLMVSLLKILLDISDNVVSFSNLVLEVVPKWLVVVVELIDQTTSTLRELTELMKSVAELVRGHIGQLSPEVLELIKKIVGLLYDHLVDFVVDHVKQLVFGFVFGSVVMSEYHHMIERVLESVVRSVVENFTTMVMYFFSRKIESIHTIRDNNAR